MRREVRPPRPIRREFSILKRRIVPIGSNGEKS
jgi:hypothetical protein